MKIKKIKKCGVEPTWDISVPEVEEYLLSNGVISHNTSSLVLSFTESCDLIRSFKINKEGTYTLPFLAPNLQQNREWYEFAWDVDQKHQLKLAAIRQKFIDQSQSTNIFLKKADSAKALLDIILFAEKLGIKTLYYLNTQKAGDSEEVCESCSV